MEARRAIQKTPSYIRAYLFITLLLPIFCPFSYFDIEGHYGLLFLYGYVINRHLWKDPWLYATAGLYEVSITMCATIFAAHCAVIPKGHDFFDFSILMILLPLASMPISIKLLCEMCSLRRALLSIFFWPYLIDFISLVCYRATQ